ncbi:MAG: hypothetical protein ACLR8P_16595 [Clostridium fessum]
MGAIIRTANLAGAHGVIIPKRRAVGLTSTVAKTSARSVELYAGGEGNQYFSHDRGAERERTLVCLRRYGRREHVPPRT